jgi:hypothetical protein
MKLRLFCFAAALTPALLSIPPGCGGGSEPDAPVNTGGSATGGVSTGGSATGGVSTGGSSPGGVSNGGSGGTATGGANGNSGAGGASGKFNATGGTSGGNTTGGSGGTSGGGTSGSGTSGGSTTVGSGGGGGLIYPPTFETVKAILQSNYGCSGADCHGGNDHNVSLLVNPQLYTTLTTFISKCESLPLVTPGMPAQSALLKILKGPCGPIRQMPDGCTGGEFGNCLKPEEIAPVEQWILMGAPQ